MKPTQEQIDKWLSALNDKCSNLLEVTTLGLA